MSKNLKLFCIYFIISDIGMEKVLVIYVEKNCLLNELLKSTSKIMNYKYQNFYFVCIPLLSF